MTPDVHLAASTIAIRVTEPPLELYTTPTAFRPNPTTVRFSRGVKIAPGDVVFDIGTGIGPLAIMAALMGAARVLAVDPVAMHCELARLNATKYSVQDTVTVYEGSLFDPFEREPELRDLKADVIIGDVSGIADPVARSLGWYSDDVPTGGPDGTEVIQQLLRSAGRYLKPEGSLYFPIAVDLSDSQKILSTAREQFGELVNALDKEYVVFPLSDEETHAIESAYNGNRPSFITIQPGRRPTWRGQIWRASRPR
jgi:methylase of polypeptide subunit release factors